MTPPTPTTILSSRNSYYLHLLTMYERKWAMAHFNLACLLPFVFPVSLCDSKLLLFCVLCVPSCVVPYFYFFAFSLSGCGVCTNWDELHIHLSVQQ